MRQNFDRNDSRSQKSREAIFFRTLKTVMAVAKPRAAGWRRLMRDAEIDSISNMDALLRMPVLRQRDVDAMRADDMPYGGLVAPRIGAMRRVSTATPQGQGPDWWNCARALAAIGAVKGDVILNCYSYHLASSGFIIDEGAFELGCAIIAAGNAPIELKLHEANVLKPSVYCGDAEQLAQLLETAEKANCDISSLNKALVFDRYIPAPLRARIEKRGVRLRQALATLDLGVIAYETSLGDGGRNEGMMINEGLKLEIVRPGTNEPAEEGAIGEVVVTRANPDYPMLRLSTGDLSKIIPGPSPCGRTGPRIAGWLGRANEVTQVVDRLIMPGQLLELGARHTCVSRMQMRVDRSEGRDTVTLRAEGPRDDAQLPVSLKRNLAEILGFNGRIDIIESGVLKDGAPLIVDARR